MFYEALSFAIDDLRVLGEEKLLEEEGLDFPHDNWIDRPDGVSFTAWLAINQARYLCALWGAEQFWDWVRQELPGHNFARWWRKYGAHIEPE